MPRERILIADDEPHVLGLCARIIEKEGYLVTAVRDGYTAIEKAQQEPFDLFLTDIQMPQLDGLETAQLVREVIPNIVCVVMTGYGTMERAIKAIQLGFTEFVEKPFKPHDLSQAINRALEKERLRRENTRLNALVPLFEINKKLMSNIAPDVLAQQVLEVTCKELGADIGTLLLYGRDQHLRVAALIGIDEARVPEPLIKELLDRRQQVLVCADTADALLDQEMACDISAQELATALVANHLLFNPLLAMDLPVGALVVAKSDSSTKFATGDAEFLSVLCGQAAIALQNARYFDDIQRAYKELQRVDHIKSEFINIAAHELRTPLAILLGHADLLADEIVEPSQRERMQIVVRNALRLRELITALLDMRLLQTGEQRVTITVFELFELIDDVLQDLRPFADGKRLDLAVSIPNDLAPIRSDRQKVHIALGNLIRNAIKFTRAEGKIEIEAQDQGKEVWISVRDTGVGIPEEEQENIFRPFYQVEDSLTREHDGIGLGLSITKGMVELCGGRIWVESKPNEGSRFTFTLPK
ncbi:MAG: response regulator [Anaerolineae bacterium]|nr:response regulator [Anaerolineae bacterium]